MTKILIILTGGIYTDGISSAWHSLGKALKENDRISSFDIHFLAIDENSSPVMIERYKQLGYNIISTPVRKSNPLIYIKNLTNILKENNYDIIHVNGSSSLLIFEMIAAKLAGVKKRITHSRNTTCGNKLLHKALLLPFNSLTNFKMACGKDAGKWLFGNSKFTVFHNGINLEKFRYNSEIRNRIREDLNLSVNDLAIGHVGRFNFQKNHEFLIDIFREYEKRHSRSKLFLFGDGKNLDNIKKKVKGNGLEGKVIFMGVKDNIDKYLQAMDIMLLPSRYEGLPNVVVEWQAAGLPSILSTNITTECAVTPLVKFMSLNDSPDLWAEKISDLTKVIGDRHRDSEKSIDSLRTEGFDIKTQAHTLLEIYRQ